MIKSDTHFQIESVWKSDSNRASISSCRYKDLFLGTIPTYTYNMYLTTILSLNVSLKQI